MAKAAAGFEKGHGPGQPAPEKFQLHPGDIEWTKPPKSAAKAPARERVNATVKALAPHQRRDLAKRIKAKLGKRPKA